MTDPVAELGFWNIAEHSPDRLALVAPDGTELTFGELLAESNRIVHALRAKGLQAGDVIATLTPNSLEMVAMMLATSQAGWYLVPINYHLVGPEIAYIIDNSEAKVFLAHERFADEAARALQHRTGGDLTLVGIGEVDGFTPYRELVEGEPATNPEQRTAGGLMTYTSGTTGKPKGVKRPLTGADPREASKAASFLLMLFGIPTMGDGVHLVTAPLYHTAVGNYMQAALNGGHAVVLMDRWTPDGMLERIDRYRVTSTHMVPTMFHRLLKLPQSVRDRYDVSSMTHAIHGAAPCPNATKQAMLDWWGPTVYEYYAATEGGGTLATPEDFEKKPGTVGKPWPISEIAVLDDDGNRVPPGEVGTVWIRMGEHRFDYYKDEQKTKETWRDGFFTVGDAGFVDEDGYLFLRDRKSDMIISGGVNIYPAEIEGVLIQHPDVDDVAVLGIPHDDWGEEVKAVVQLGTGTSADGSTTERLLAHCRDNLAGYKVPRSIDYVDELPRDPNGKLYKRRLRDPYWVGRERQI